MYESSKPGFASTGHSFKGAAWVWLSAGGLALGIVMILALLALVSIKAVASYWPRAIEQMTLEGEAEPMVGIVIKEVDRRDAGGNAHPQLLIYRGNAELHPQPYVYIEESAIVERQQPEGLVRVERLENGPALLWPVALETAEGRFEADSPSYAAQLESMLAEAQVLRQRILGIERREIGAISRALQDLLVAERSGEKSEAEAQLERAELQREFERLQQEVVQLRASNEDSIWMGKDAAGEEVVIAANEMLGLFEANAAGFWGRLGEMGRRIASFLTEAPRQASTEGGVYPAIIGTVVLTLAMTFFVTPLGVIAALYLSEYARQGPLVRLMRICVNNLAGVPSIVFGVFGLAFFVYFIGGNIDQRFFSEELQYLQKPTFGTPGILWASLTLALLTLPVVIVTTEEALSTVSRGVRDAALACGASKWQAIRRVVLPASLPGILTGVILAMARGAGEVAPLMLVGAVDMAQSLPIDDVAPYIHPERKFMHLGYHIYDLGMSSSNNDAANPLVYSTALLLILVILVLNLAAILLRNRLRSRNPVGYF